MVRNAICSKATARKFIAGFLIAGLLIVAATPVWAWGPSTTSSIVTAAAHVLSQDRAMRIVRLRKYVREGAGASSAVLAEMYPNYSLNPRGAIEREMILLQSIRNTGIDPYFVYRLGMLGQMVANETAPLAKGNPTYRTMYYNDVDNAVARAEMKSASRLIVDPATYFRRIQIEAGAQDTTIEIDYRTGLGFDGFASGALSIDVSRSVNAVADTWYTILVGDVASVNVSRGNMRDYHLNALGYYLDLGNLAEANESHDHIRGLRLRDVNTLKAIGDLFFDSGHFERAMEQYRQALVADPGRRDVMEKVSLYYEQVGERALAEKRLEDARDAFTSALNADQLHPSAQRKLIDAEDLIDERNARLQAARAALADGDGALSESESAALQANYADAITNLRVAQTSFAKVTREFPIESESATVGLRKVSLLMREYKNNLINSAQNLSGSGFEYDAQRLAKNADDINERALRSMLDRQYRSTVQALRQQLQDSLRLNP